MFYKEDIHIGDQKESLLGRGGIGAFELIKENNEMSVSNKWTSVFPEIYSGIGNFEDPYVIKVKQGVKALYYY